MEIIVQREGDVKSSAEDMKFSTVYKDAGAKDVKSSAVDLMCSAGDAKFVKV